MRGDAVPAVQTASHLFVDVYAPLALELLPHQPHQQVDQLVTSHTRVGGPAVLQVKVEVAGRAALDDLVKVAAPGGRAVVAAPQGLRNGAQHNTWDTGQHAGRST